MVKVKDFENILCNYQCFFGSKADKSDSDISMDHQHGSSPIAYHPK